MKNMLYGVMNCKMKMAFLGVLLAVLSVPALSRTKPSVTVIKVKIEATELDKAMLLDKLNKHGKGHGLKFEATDGNYQYRILFGTGQGKTQALYRGSGGGFNTSASRASVYDSKGEELFSFERAGRWTDTGATNAVAEEIIKRLIRWWHTSEGKAEAP